jgi:hypothetical protein
MKEKEKVESDLQLIQHPFPSWKSSFINFQLITIWNFQMSVDWDFTIFNLSNEYWKNHHGNVSNKLMIETYKIGFSQMILEKLWHEKWNKPLTNHESIIMFSWCQMKLWDFEVNLQVLNITTSLGQVSFFNDTYG